MPLVKYVSNLSYTDGNGAISLGAERVLTLGGLPLEVSDTELVLLQSKFNIEVVDEVIEPSEDVESDPVNPPVDPTPADAAQNSVADVLSTVSVGSTPSSLTNPNSPTPPAGN